MPSRSAKFNLKLLVDDTRNKVVLAETDQDFVDVLISLLSLPMGKVARLLESEKMVLGCFKNLNKSVADMGIDHFETEACKSMLLNPKSTKEIHCKRLKLNMSYTDDTSFFVCPNFLTRDSCQNAYSCFNTSKCPCGASMSATIYVPEKEQVSEVIGDMTDGVFVKFRSLFIVTDDLKVRESSIPVIMQVLNDKGYLGLTDLRETLLSVGFNEVVTLLGCLFTSETPLTSAFLKKNIITKMNKTISPPVEKARGVEQSSSLYSVKVFVRKFDREILYVECDEGLIDSLFNFLVLPLEFAYSLSNDSYLCRIPYRRASASKFDQIPDIYICNNNEPFKHNIHSSPVYECRTPSSTYDPSWCTFARQIDRSLLLGRKILIVSPNDPKARLVTSSNCGNGFMKRNTKFIVSNDLYISPKQSTSYIDLLKKTPSSIFELEEHQISISKTELIGILRAFLISSSPLNGLSNFLTKKVKEET